MVGFGERSEQGDNTLIQIVYGDIFQYPADIRVNPVNCVGVMGAGLALEFKKRSPKMFSEYRQICSKGELKPGKLHVWTDPETSEITINFPTKRHWRNKSQLGDIELGLIELAQFLQDYIGSSVVMPALGCGLGGLAWDDVYDLISRYLSDIECFIILCLPK